MNKKYNHVLIANAYRNENKTTGQIAEEYGCCQESVRYILRKFGITPDGRGKGIYPRPDNTAYYQEIAAAVDEGYSYRAVAEAFGISHQRVAQILQLLEEKEGNKDEN